MHPQRGRGLEENTRGIIFNNNFKRERRRIKQCLQLIHSLHMKYIFHILEIGVKAVLTSFAVVVSKSSTDPISFDKYLEWEHIASRGISKFVN